MTFEQFITASNVIETIVDADTKANDLLKEALEYQRIANGFRDTENSDAVRCNGYYRDTMKRCANRIAYLTGLDKMVIHRVMAKVATERL
jgi:hypothetical protein